MISEALTDTRVVVVNSARQVGKSTLAELIVGFPLVTFSAPEGPNGRCCLPAADLLSVVVTRRLPGSSRTELGA